MKSTDQQEDRDLRLQYARTFLFGRCASFYGGRPIIFQIGKMYRSFEGMLNRDLLHLHFDVREVAAEVRMQTTSSTTLMTFHSYGGSESSQGGQGSLADYARSKLRRELSGASKMRILVDGRNFEVDMLSDRFDHLELRFTPSRVPNKGKYRISSRSVLREWVQALLEGYSKFSRSLQAHATSEFMTVPAEESWILSRRISSVDVDLSGERPPDAFQWKETSIFESASYGDLDELELAAILRASGISLPSNAHLQAKAREDLSKDSSCLRLRYVHLIPDITCEASEGALEYGNGEAKPPWLSRGYIVMEDDYLEILIDATSGKVFSESRKWRPESPSSERPAV